MEVTKLKQLLGIPLEETEQDGALQFVLDDVTETIVNYCNLKKMPTGLVNTGYRMAIDLYRCDRPGIGSAPMGIASVSEGGTSTSFTSAADALTGGVLKDYKAQLNRFRRLSW